MVMVGWVLVGWAAVVLILGATLQIPGWLQRLSPFEWLPAMPAESFALGPVIGLAAVAGAITIAGFAVFARRDVH
jgi:ABC-2 type transport system permease protein